MPSRLLSLAALVSLLLIAALAALWMRSYYIPDTFARTSVTSRPDGSAFCRTTLIMFAAGELRLSIDEHQLSPAWVQRLGVRHKPHPLEWRDNEYLHSLPDFFRWRRPAFQWSGFACARFRDRPFGIYGTPAATQSIAVSVVKVPLWMLLLIAATLPSVWFLRRSFCRPRPGICPYCAYDLRATPDRCPECGTNIDCAAS